MNSHNATAAAALAALSYRIFPCNSDKTPQVKAWEQVEASIPFMVALQWKADSLIGLPTGSQGLIVFDADCKPNRPNGVRAFEQLCRECGFDLNQVFAVQTPSGGLHFYFRTETPYGNSTGSLPAGIDVRGRGGYVIGPGSVLPDGRSYFVAHGSWDSIPALPDALANLLRPKAPAPSLNAPASSQATERDRSYALGALTDETSKLAALRAGDRRNQALNVSAFTLGTLVANGSLDANEVASALFDAATANGHLAKHGESQTRKTIESGLRAGIDKPRATLEIGGPDLDLTAIVANGLSKTKRQSHVTSKAGQRSVNLVTGTDIQAKPITWLWDGYLSQGKLTLLAGNGGTGKSTLAFSIAATITNGGTWPDGSRCNLPGNVLIWSSEDDPSDTIKPRMMAVGANQSRYAIISGTTDEQGDRCPFDAASDMDALRAAVMSIGGVSLLIIDPIVSAVTGDMHKANDVRRGLQCIVDFAAEMNCAVLGISHFAKATAGKNSAERVIGSQAFTALARMVLVAAKEEESDRRVFTRAKSNNSLDTGGFAYTIEPITLNEGIVATRVVWGDALEGSARSILLGVEENEPSKDDTSKRGTARRYLLEALANGPVPSNELFVDALERHNISKDTLRRAKEDVGVQVIKAAFAGGWMWSLPKQEITN